MLLYEHLSDTYLNKINTNLNILQYKFIEFLYELQNKIVNPISAILTNDEKTKLQNGYLVKFTYNLNEYILYLKERPSSDINKKTFYIDDFYDIKLLIDFVYKYTNFNTITNLYDNDLNLRITQNENDITVR